MLERLAAERAADLRAGARARATLRDAGGGPEGRRRARAAVRLGRLLVRAGERMAGEDLVPLRSRRAAL
jgi:hypothetical protein